jgi:hypothetical protein
MLNRILFLQMPLEVTSDRSQRVAGDTEPVGVAFDPYIAVLDSSEWVAPAETREARVVAVGCDPLAA